ncbi:MAG: putative S-layer protein [Candidatus Woesearchaeota archaeon]|nr:putative S-layer protein [Candidatus Woesearchaeota archaeon]
MKKLGILIVFLLILTSIVLAVPAFNIPDINMNEDTVDNSIDLDNYATGVTWTWTGNAHINVAKNSLNVVTLTPQANWNGIETIRFTATDPSDSYFDDVTVTVNPVNDVPTYSPTIPEQIWNEGNDQTLNLATYFHDADGDTLTYTWTPATLDDIDVSVAGNIVTFHPRDSKFVGENDIVFTASDGIASVNSGTITLRVEPNICSEGQIGQLTVTINNPDDGDEFKPGDTMDMDIKVDNDYTKDLDIVVTAYLYDMTKGERVDDVESDSTTIDSDDSDTFELSMEIPSDVTDGDDYRLYIRAIEDSYEDRQCDYDYVSIDIKKEKNDMSIPTFTLSPSTATCGDEISATIKTENIGRSNEQDVYFRLENSELKLNLQTDTFDVDKNDDYTLRNIVFTIPKDAAERTYTILAEVFFDDGAASNSKSATLIVSGCQAVIPGQETVLTPIEPSFDVNAGDTKQVLVQITNNGNDQVVYTLSLSASGFGQSTNVPVTLDAGETKVVPITLIVNSDASGSYTGIITVKSDSNIIKTSTVNVNVKGKQATTPTGGVTGIPTLFGSNILWILGDIVLVIVAIFFIRLIFTSGRGGKMKEMK